MSFEAYMRNIETRTGKTPRELYRLASAAGVLHEGAKAMQIVAWLKATFGLGHGHAMAVLESFKRNGWQASARASAGNGAGGAKKRAASR
jgi:hypothetical protein